MEQNKLNVKKNVYDEIILASTGSPAIFSRIIEFDISK